MAVKKKAAGRKKPATAKQKAAQAKFAKNSKAVAKLVKSGMSRKTAWKKVKS